MRQEELQHLYQKINGWKNNKHVTATPWYDERKNRKVDEMNLRNLADAADFYQSRWKKHALILFSLTQAESPQR